MNAPLIYSSLAAEPDFGELIDLFLLEIPHRIAIIESQTLGCDWQQLSRTAHQLKGAAGSYGFDGITPYAARLESAAMKGLPEAEILAAADELLDLCRRLRAGLPPSDG